MLNRLKEIEKELLDVYHKLKEQYPGLHHLSFEIDTWEYNNKTDLHGYYHIGKGDCKEYRNITELATIIDEAKERRAKNEILYQSFEGIL